MHTLPAPASNPDRNPHGSLHAPVLAALPHPAWLVELAGRRVVAANGAAAALLGLPLASLVGSDAEGLCASPEDLAWWSGAAAGDFSSLDSDTLLAVPDGRVLPCRRSIQVLAPDMGLTVPTHALVAVLDRSAEQQAQAGSDALNAQLQATLEATADGLLVTDVHGRPRGCNRRFVQLWRLQADLNAAPLAMAQWTVAMARQVSHPAAYADRLAALRLDARAEAQDRIELADGRVFDRVTRPLLVRGEPQGRVFSFRDLTERLAAEERIDNLATHCALTGLPNRAALTRFVAAAEPGLALLVIDLDRFRQVNDSLGHDSGDDVLCKVADRIQGCLREDDFLARLGGDSFCVVLAGSDGPAAEGTARRVLNTVAQPCDVGGAPFTLTCSIGIALAPAHGQTLDDLLHHAEAAMRQVKDGGRANVRLHQARGQSDRRAHIRLDHAMRQALVSNRFRLHYQPQVALDDGRILGAEALLRWRDPERGDVPPARFIPVAEESGFIVAIGDWVLSQAVRQAALWQQRGHGVKVAVNVSAVQFQQAQFVDRVASVLAVSGLSPELLELELTESILVRDAEDALQRLHALARLGVRLAIDDFGTGYSSLGYLKRFPLDKLKIDRSFISGLPAEGSDAAIVRAILQMAQALDLNVIAEGVETEAQRQFLHASGCLGFQGHLYAAAMDALSFEERLAGGKAPLGDAAAAASGAAAPRMRLVHTG